MYAKKQSGKAVKNTPITCVVDQRSENKRGDTYNTLFLVTKTLLTYKIVKKKRHVQLAIKLLEMVPSCMLKTIECFT